MTETSLKLKTGLADMLKGGAIMDVTNAEQAKIAEDAGAVSVMALERVPSDIRKHGGVARMSAVDKILEIQETVSIPVMAKVRIGHFVEAQILQEMKVDFIDESEVLTPADEENHVDKHAFRSPSSAAAAISARRFGVSARVRRSSAPRERRARGTSSKRCVTSAASTVTCGDSRCSATRSSCPKRSDSARRTSSFGSSPGRESCPSRTSPPAGVSTPADAALCMHLGAESVFVGSGIFKSEDPAKRAAAIVKAVTHYQDPKALVEASRGLGEPMPGIDVRQLDEKDLLQTRGW